VALQTCVYIPIILKAPFPVFVVAYFRARPARRRRTPALSRVPVLGLAAGTADTAANVYIGRLHIGRAQLFGIMHMLFGLGALVRRRRCSFCAPLTHTDSFRHFR
jgi:hypothetical protein